MRQRLSVAACLSVLVGCAGPAQEGMARGQARPDAEAPDAGALEFRYQVRGGECAYFVSRDGKQCSVYGDWTVRKEGKIRFVNLRQDFACGERIDPCGVGQDLVCACSTE